MFWVTRTATVWPLFTSDAYLNASTTGEFIAYVPRDRRGRWCARRRSGLGCPATPCDAGPDEPTGAPGTAGRPTWSRRTTAGLRTRSGKPAASCCGPRYSGSDSCWPGERVRAPRPRRSALFRAYLLRMGPLYMKAGQVLATQSGLLPKRAVDDLRSFFSDLPPMSRRALDRTLARNFPTGLPAVFADFDFCPLATGSVAQVHRATLVTGEQVAVKVVKRGVPGRLRGSATLVAGLLRFGHLLIRPLRRFDLPDQFAELRPMLTGQCDMLAEAAVQIEVAGNFRNHPVRAHSVPVSRVLHG